MTEGSPRRPRLLALVGPTGTGKTATAVALAERLTGEIVNCDALQIYRSFSIGTAKPNPAEMRGIPHHLIDFQDPARPYSMGQFVRDADRVIEEIGSRGRVPVVVGGTGLYLRALLRGVLEVPTPDSDLRVRMERIQMRHGAWKLHRCLHRLDPITASRLEPTDAQRIKRALDLAIRSRRTWSERLGKEGTWAASTERYDSVKVGLTLHRPALRELLEKRVREFFDAGWVEEVQSLLDSGVPETANAFKALGYREILDALKRGEDPRERIPRIVQGTSRYAKRQMTWFRKEPAVHWLESSEPDLVEQILALWKASD